VLNDLRRLVEQRAAAGDEIMLAEYGGSLNVVTPFSRDPAALDAGIDHLQEASALGGATLTASVASSTAVRDLAREAGNADDPNTSAALLSSSDAIASSRVQYLYEQARRSFLALDSMVLSLAGLPGRKALLWVTDGVPKRPGIEFIAMQEGLEGAAIQGQRYDLSRVYRQVIEQANAHEVTFYTLDARGPNPNLSQTAEFKDVAGVAVLAEGIPRLDTPDFEATRNASLQEPLLDLANATGGHAVLNTFEFATAFERLVADFDSYYSLGFVSPTSGDGKYHRVDVKVRRPGLRVRHRAGFLDKAAADRVEDRVRSFLVQGWESNPMGVALQFGEPRKKHRTWRVPVLVRIPSQAVTLLPQDGEQVGKLQIFVGVRDDDGRESRVSRLAQEIAVPTGDEGGHGDLGYRVELEMRPGPASLVVGVWDEVGGGESYVFQRVIVGGAT
jgi:VWFA-related protein